MNIRRTIKMLSIAGAGVAAGALLVPGSAMSATPGFGGWSATSGTIDQGTACPTGFTCSVLVSGDGFLQLQVNDNSSAASYVRTIVTDTTATGTASTLPFSDENYVKTDGTSTGIAGQQVVNDSSNGNFNSTVQILTGFAAVGGNNQVTIDQSLTADPTPAPGDEFSTGFNMQVNLDNAGTQTGRSMQIDQSTALGNSTDKQIFAIRAAAGSALTTSGTVTLGGTPVTWSAGNDVLLTWVGQGLTLGTLGSSLFGYEGFTNNTTAASNSQFDQASAGPFDWNQSVIDAFGAQPAF